MEPEEKSTLINFTKTNKDTPMMELQYKLTIKQGDTVIDFGKLHLWNVIMLANFFNSVANSVIPTDILAVHEEEGMIHFEQGIWIRHPDLEDLDYWDINIGRY